MKKITFALSALFLLTLVGCGNQVTTSSTGSSSSSSSTSTESLSTSENSEISSVSSSQQPEEIKFLEKLKLGFSVKNTYQTQYNNSTPSVYLSQTTVGSEVLKFEEFSGKTWEDAKKTSSSQYEKGEENFAYTVKINTDGTILKSQLLLKDEITQTDDVVLWQDTGLDNAFASLSEENFTLGENKTYNLDLSEKSLLDEDYAQVIKNLSVQLYTKLEGVSNHYFLNKTLEEFSITLNEENDPISYKGKFVEEAVSDGYGGTDIKKYFIEGEFTALGENLVEKLTQLEAKYPALDQMLTKLQKQNYTFNIHRFESDDWTGSYDNVLGTGMSDGKGNFELNATGKTGAWGSAIKGKYGYKKQSDETYRKYEITDSGRTYTGEILNGSVDDVLPSFKLTSGLFEIDPLSTEYFSVYHFVKPDLYIENYLKDDIFVNFGLGLYPWGYTNDFTITLTKDSIRFYGTTGSRVCDVTFFKIGSTSTISATVTE